MSELIVTGVAADPLARAHAAVDGLRELPLDLLADDEVLQVWRELEVLRRRLESVEHGVIVQATSRHLGDNTGAGDARVRTFAAGHRHR